MTTVMADLLYELTITLSPRDSDPEPVLRLLEHYGIKPDEVAHTTSRGRTKLSSYLTTKAQARKLERTIAPRIPAGAQVVLRSLQDAEWQEAWKKYFRPFKITPRIRIIPAWLIAKTGMPPPDGIFIDSVMAFGTGMHPTTQAMARFIEKERGKFADFFDVGTGTGILSLIAAKHGARRIVSIDFDPDAVATAQRNFEVNGLNGVSLHTADFRKFTVRRTFDFIAANLLANELLATRDKIIALVRPGKYLGVSGIWRDVFKRFRACFPTKELRCLAIVHKKGWYSLLYRRRR
jgi:ribosomal protein L11 methyltransferase